MKNKKMKRVMILGIIVVALSLFLYLLSRGEDASIYYGEIEPDSYDVYATVPGIIDELLVREGEKIQAEQVVMSLDASSAAILQEKAELADQIALENVDKSVSPVREEERNIQNSSISQLISQRNAMSDSILGAKSLYEQSLSSSEALKTAYELQQSNYDKMLVLFETGAVSRQDLDVARLALVNSKSAYDSARLKSDKAQSDINSLINQRTGLDAQISAAEEQLKSMNAGYDEPDQRIAALNSEMIALDAQLAKINADKYEIKALNGGVVESINYAKGEYVSTGAPVISLYNPKKTLVKIYIHEKDLTKISLGMEMEFKLEVEKDIKLKGMVKRIATEPMFTPVNVVMSEDRERLVYLVELELTMTDQVRPGMLISTDFGELE
ncbi:HlyD family efflux transporter periplasmic adaptor subunit [Clostridia bacterium]|nr:HlyD family efflux transporter periplasmic adaptor subunit [Clostridia bacterium]